MPAYSTPPPGVVPGTMAYDTWKQATGAYNQAEQDPAWQAAQQQKAAELNAYRSAQTASMGMMTSGPNSTVASDPSTAFQKFVQSGYTPQQALSDGWATSGNGNRGWESMVGYQAPLNPQGMIGAPYAQQQIQQYQTGQAVANQYRNGYGAVGSGGSGGPQINQAAQQYYNQGAGSGGQSQDFWKAQLGSNFDQNAWNMAQGGGASARSPASYAQPATLGPQQGMTGNAAQAYGQAPQRGGIYQQLNSMLSGGGGINPFAQGQQSSAAAPRMQQSSGMPAGGYGQRQNAMGQSPAWQSFLSNLKPAAGF